MRKPSHSPELFSQSMGESISACSANSFDTVLTRMSVSNESQFSELAEVWTPPVGPDAPVRAQVIVTKDNRVVVLQELGNDVTVPPLRLHGSYLRELPLDTIVSLSIADAHCPGTVDIITVPKQKEVSSPLRSATNSPTKPDLQTVSVRFLSIDERSRFVAAAQAAMRQHVASVKGELEAHVGEPLPLIDAARRKSILMERSLAASFNAAPLLEKELISIGIVTNPQRETAE